MCPPFLLSHNSLESAIVHADTALDTLGLVYLISRKLLSGSDIIGLGDSSDRTVLSAQTAANALVLGDLIAEQLLTYSGRTSALLDVSLILISELLDSREYRVRSGLAESAERRALHVVSQAVDKIEILHSALAL